MERGSLRVRRHIARINREVVEAPLKKVYRTLPLAKDSIDALDQQKKKVGSSPWVFPGPTDGPMSPDSVLYMLHRVLKRAGLPRVRFHDLRHTFATLALQNGVDVKTVSGMLGYYSAAERGGESHGTGADNGPLNRKNHLRKVVRSRRGKAAPGPHFFPVWVKIWVRFRDPR